MSYIYQPEEIHARFNLQQFILSIGTPETQEKANTNGISSDELLRIFGVFYKDDAQYLTPTTVEHFLLAGGWLAKEAACNQLYLKITPEKFKDLTKDVQAFILNWIPYPTQVPFRGIYNGYTERNIAPEKIVINNFVKHFCIDCRKLDIKQYVPQKTLYRSSAEEIYQFFSLICETYGLAYPPIKKRFYEVLREDHKIDVVQGAVRGKTGVRTLRDYIFPNTDVDILLSLQYGTSIITLGSSETECIRQICPTGRFDSLTPAQKLELQETRIRRFAGDEFNQEETLEKTSVGQITNRTEAKVYASVKQAAKEGIMEERFEVSRGEENNLSKLVRNNTKLQELEDPETESERTSDETIYPAAEDIPKVSDASDVYQDGSDVEHENTGEYDDGVEHEDEVGVTEHETTFDDIIEGDRSAEESVEDDNAELISTGTQDEEEEVYDPLEDDEEAKAFLNSPPDDEVEEPITITFEHILNMCKAVPMYQDPSVLTVETLQSILDKMNTDLKAVDIYEDLLAELAKWKEDKDKATKEEE